MTLFKHLTTASLATLVVLNGSSFAISAQTTTSSQPAARNTIILKQTDTIALNRAKNLARQAAEAANGGLNNYRAESSMYGPALESPYVDNGDETWTFTFLGRKLNSSTPTIKSIVTVAKNGSQVTVNYNKPITAQ